MKFASLLSVLLFCNLSFAQASGKMVSINSDGWCGSVIYFTSDSVAWYLSGCESMQQFTKLNYTIASTGELIFKKVSRDEYKPVLSLTKGEVSFQSYDSLFALPKLVFYDKGRACTESFWKLLGDTVQRQSGSLLSAISERFFTDTTLKIRFPELDRLKDSLPLLDYTDFKGTGSRYIVNGDFPPCFFIYSHMSYNADLCNLSELKFKIIKGKLHFLEKGKWILVKD